MAEPQLPPWTFDQPTYNRTDPKARKITSRIFSHFKADGQPLYKVVDKETFRVDLMVLKLSSGEWFGVECEVCQTLRNWVARRDRRYSDVHVPLRKEKYLRETDQYFQFSPELDEVFVMSGKDILSSEKKRGQPSRAPNGDMVSGDYFCVPRDSCRLFRVGPDCRIFGMDPAKAKVLDRPGTNKAGGETA